jgi:hypothetical protein
MVYEVIPNKSYDCKKLSNENRSFHTTSNKQQALTCLVKMNLHFTSKKTQRSAYKINCTSNWSQWMHEYIAMSKSFKVDWRLLIKGKVTAAIYQFGIVACLKIPNTIWTSERSSSNNQIELTHFTFDRWRLVYN